MKEDLLGLQWAYQNEKPILVSNIEDIRMVIFHDVSDLSLEEQFIGIIERKRIPLFLGYNKTDVTVLIQDMEEAFKKIPF